MNLSAIFIKRPIMTLLVMSTVLFFGIVAYRSLPVSDLPSIEYPTIQVSVDYPGANPETMANNITAPLEQQFLTIQGIKTISSTSVTGSSTIVLQFNLDKSLDSAATDVQAAITAANPQLPQNLPYAPTFTKVNPTATPIIYIAVTSSSFTLGELYEYAHNVIGERISIINGVSQVITYGEPFAVRIQVDPQKLTARGIGIDQLGAAIQKQNVNNPVGVLFGPHKEHVINADGQLFDAAPYNEMIVKNKDGAIVRVKDIGHAINSLQDDKYTLTFFTPNERQNNAVVLAVQKQIGANTVEIVNNIQEMISNLSKELPASIQLWDVFNEAVFIQESLRDMQFTLLIAILLVVIVIFIYLGKILDTVIPSLAIPLSVIGTFVVLNIFGFNIDILSLLAITLSIGFLVDDAIVVLENIVRRVEHGERPFDAAVNGSKQISITILSMTLCLISVFIPLLFMTGVMGRIFHEFAVTIVSAVFISGIVSLSLTPMLCSRLIPPLQKEKKQSKIKRFSEKFNEKLLNVYSPSLEWVIKHRFITLLIGILTLVFTIILFIHIPKDFLPPDDIGGIEGFTQGDDSASPFEMERLHEEILNILQKNPDYKLGVSLAGLPMDNQGLFFVLLKPLNQRPPIQKIISKLYKQLTEIPGLKVFLKPFPLISLDVGTSTSKGDYQYVLQSLNDKDLYEYAPIMFEKMKTLPGFSQLYSDLEVKQPQVNLHILRDRASVLNVTAESIENALGYAYAYQNLSPINTPNNQYYVILEVMPAFYRDPSQLFQLYVTSTNGNLVPLSQVTEIVETLGPLSINHLNGFPSVTISFNLDIPLSKALAELNQLANDVLPPNVKGEVQGTASAFKESFASLTSLLLITIFLIYVILGILYENFFHPLSVMSTLPPAAIGGLITLYMFGQTLSLYSFVGFIMLLGIVMKNGIILVDFACEGINEGKNIHDAIKSACLIRFRPILMTTFAALMGAIPIALGIGGMTALSRRSLGLVIVGGLLISQVLTLFLTPVTFIYLELFREKIKAWGEKRGKPAPDETG